jgi:aerobic-type carbon monoxide dehydrogenase small subunit (CoxS/CutS family)
VVVGGQAVRACTMRVGSVEGREVTTIEGLAKAEVLHPVQEAFARHAAFQCGFCTPGLVMGAYALLLENPKVGRAEAAQKLEGHLCRCGANSRVLDAVESAAAQMKGSAK